jgi:hypothetical protein
MPIPAAVWSKTKTWSRLVAGIAVSNSTDGSMFVYYVVFCVSGGICDDPITQLEES